MNHNMASCRELNKLTTNMNTIPSSGMPSRNSQGICNVSQHHMVYNASQSDQQGTPVNTPLPRSVLTANNPNQDSISADTPPSQRQVESFTPYVRQNDRFVNPSGKPLQPGTIIICDKIPFVVSNNSKIYNFTGGSFKQLYVADPSKHEFLVSLANSPSTFSSIINSVIGLLPRFTCKQTDSSKHANKTQVQSVIKASNSEAFNNNGNKDLNVSTDTITDVDISDLVYPSPDVVHHKTHNNPSLHENLFQDSIQNNMLTHYNRIVIGSFEDFFQSVNTNNLAEVLQALKELNFMLANRAMELTAHYNLPLEPCQIIAEEVPNLLGLTFIAPQLTIWSTASEENPTPKVIHTISTANSCLHYQGTTNILKGQTLNFIQIEIIVIHITILLVNVIHPILLGIPLIQVIIRQML